jgi:Dienelactone hydrolase and related enzymes
MSDALLEPDDLSDFDRRILTLENTAKPVYVTGQGPAVIVMTEMPGISPHVARFARWVRDAGFRVYMPSLFGKDGDVPDAETAAGFFGGHASALNSGRSAAARRAPWRTGCERLQDLHMMKAEDRASAPSACASLETSR